MDLERSLREEFGREREEELRAEQERREAELQALRSAAAGRELELQRQLDSEVERRRAEVEDVLQRGFVAVQVGELWVDHMQRQLNSAGDDPERARALADELAAAERSLDTVRTHVARLYARGRRLGIGSRR